MTSVRAIVTLVAGVYVFGGGEPPFIGVEAGNNERMAWGFTFAGIDMVDVFVEETNPADRNQVRYNGAWEPLRIVEAKADNGVKLELLPDGSIRSAGARADGTRGGARKAATGRAAGPGVNDHEAGAAAQFAKLGDCSLAGER